MSGTGTDAALSPGRAPRRNQRPRPSPGTGALSATADDGYRNATEFLRARLRISAAEARRRLTLAAELLPRTGAGGHIEPPVREELAAAVASGTVASRAATVVTLALDRVRHICLPEAAATMEHALTLTAIENDAATSWFDRPPLDRGAGPGRRPPRRNSYFRLE